MSCEEGFVIWLTGLPAAGKTTLANALRDELRKAGKRVELLDGDEVRKWLSPNEGFTREDRERHLMRVAYVSRLLARNGVAVIASFVSPYREVRRRIREIVEADAKFIEVYVKCPLEVVMRRDPKGLYKKAMAGEIRNFTGVDDPYEEPEDPEVLVDTSEMTLEEEVETILSYLRRTGLL